MKDLPDLRDLLDLQADPLDHKVSKAFLDRSDLPDLPGCRVCLVLPEPTVFPVLPGHPVPLVLRAPPVLKVWEVVPEQSRYRMPPIETTPLLSMPGNWLGRSTRTNFTTATRQPQGTGPAMAPTLTPQ